jgi:hypothetical protein
VSADERSLHVFGQNDELLLIRASAAPFDRQYAANVAEAYAQGWRRYPEERAAPGGVARIEERPIYGLIDTPQ